MGTSMSFKEFSSHNFGDERTEIAEMISDAMSYGNLSNYIGDADDNLLVNDYSDDGCYGDAHFVIRRRGFRKNKSDQVMRILVETKAKKHARRFVVWRYIGDEQLFECSDYQDDRQIFDQFFLVRKEVLTFF